MSEADARESVIENLINHLAGLPSIGRKTAQRLAYHLLSQDSGPVQELARALTDAKARIHACSECGNYTEREVCRICASDRRQRDLICVVEKPADILAFERSGTFPGIYHVLGGSISPLDGIGPGDLNFARLWEYILVQADRQTRGYVAKTSRNEFEQTRKDFEDCLDFMVAKLRSAGTRHKLDLSGTNFISRVAQRYGIADKVRKGPSQHQGNHPAEHETPQPQVEVAAAPAGEAEAAKPKRVAKPKAAAPDVDA